jgi:hypothetical protein
MVEIDNTEVKKLWNLYGGSQHGPHVEQYFIEEQKFYIFARELIIAAQNKAMDALAEDLTSRDLPGHIADQIRDSCREVLGKVVMIDDSIKIADAVVAKITSMIVDHAGPPKKLFEAYALVERIAKMGWVNSKPNVDFEDFQDEAIAITGLAPGDQRHGNASEV